MRNRTLRSFYVYILASHSKRLYIGVTNNLERRCYEHWHSPDTTFAGRYNINRLVYLENFENDVGEAIAREKQLKKWSREKKIALIESMNPRWTDLSEGWYSRDRSVSDGLA